MNSDTLPPLEKWRVCTLKSAAKELGVEYHNLRDWRSRCQDFPQPFLKLGSIWLYDFLAIRSFKDSHAPYGYLARRQLGKL